MELIRELKRNIDIDKNRNIIAKWHDESHINHYIYIHDNWMMLPPSYCYAEGWDLPFEPKILVREKSRYFDTIEMKNGRAFAKLLRLYKRMKR